MVTVETVLGGATIDEETEFDDAVKAAFLVDEPRVKSKELPSVPSP